MKTVQLTASVSRSGGGIFPIIKRISQCLRERNVQVDVVGLEDEYTNQDHPEWGSHEPVTAKPYPPKSFGYAPKLTPILREINADLVHLHGIWMYPSWANFAWAKRSRHPYIISPHGMLDRWALANSGFKKRIVGGVFENRHLAGAACLHALSQAEVAAMQNYGLVNPICHIPNGVDLASPRALDVPVWRKEFGNSHKILLFLGRIHPKKGLLSLLSAWAQLKRENNPAIRDWVLAIAGWNQNGHQEELEQRAFEQNIAKSVKFIGPLYGDLKIASLQTADAFVLPSFSEGLPVAVLEAWAYSLPVGMTPECNIPQGFSSGAAVKMTHSANGIAEGLRELLSMSDQERFTMGKRGLNLVEQHFNWDVIVTQFLEVYQWMLGDGSLPACVEVN